MPATKTRTKSKAKPKAKAKAKSSVGMTMPEVKAKAKRLGVVPGNMNKYDLIHAIQESECNTPCYGTCGGHCDQTGCCFITDCVRVK